MLGIVVISAFRKLGQEDSRKTSETISKTTKPKKLQYLLVMTNVHIFVCYLCHPRL